MKIKKGCFELLCEKRGVKILSVKKRSPVFVFLSTYHYKVVFEFEGGVYEIKAWAGLHSAKKDNIFFSIIEYLDEKNEKKEMDEFSKTWKRRIVRPWLVCLGVIVFVVGVGSSCILITSSYWWALLSLFSGLLSGCLFGKGVIYG